MTLSRRNSIKVIGAGMIVAAAGAAIAVPGLDAMPATAVEGWSGPPSSERDPRRRALAFALLAPSPHNLQSWLVDLGRDGEVLLFVDGGRLLPQTDPLSRQILIGQGCFLEILSIAAAAEGWRTETQLFPAGSWIVERPVARIVFSRLPAPSVDPLFAEVPRRRTVKSRFEPRPLEAAHRNALLASADLHGLRLSIVDEPARVERLRSIAIAGSELEMNTPRTHKESIDVVRIGSAEIAAHRDGISIRGPMIWMLRQLGVMTPDKAMTPGTMAWNSGRDYILAGYASAPAFGWLASRGNDRATQIAAGRTWVRLQLAASALGVSLQPHSQTLQEYPEMEALRVAMRAETGVEGDETLQMFFRLGYAADPGPSPRRALDSIVKS
ncbi:MAG: twin-arginine translocation pathway signal protein [Rhodospirillales bacterium]|nr:twin-arginine translocation pathway signal protein [Rhodospirillales bacterium]